MGQLVAESVRFYGAHFWRSLLLGIPPAAVGVGLALLHGPWFWWFLFVLAAGAPLLTVSYVGASVLVHQPDPDPQRLLRAFFAGWVVLLPVPFLYAVLVLPAVAWLALVGLVVPVVLVEERSLRESCRRAIALARVDYVHALGALATLVITSFLTATVLFFLLRSAGESARTVAAFLALLVISPVLFLGAALLYHDQAARAIRSAPRPRRSGDAQVPADDDPDLAGRADAEGEPRPAA